MNYYSDRSVDVITELFLDFYKLYLKFGDYWLLAKGEVASTIKCYELCGLDWYNLLNNL